MVSSLSFPSIVWCCRSTRVTVPCACWEPSNLFQTFSRLWWRNNAEFIEAVCWETCRRSVPGVPDHCENLLGSTFADVTAGPPEAKQSWGRCRCSFLTFYSNEIHCGCFESPGRAANALDVPFFSREPLFSDSWDGHESVSPANYMAVSPECMLPWKHSHFSAVRRCWRTSKRHYLVAWTHIEQHGAPWLTLPKHSCWVSSLLNFVDFQVPLLERFECRNIRETSATPRVCFLHIKVSVTLM